MTAPVSEQALRELLERMVAARQLSATDAEALLDAPPSNMGAVEEDVLRWLGTEYEVAFTTLEETLGKGVRGSSWFVYSNVHPNPIEQDVIQAADAYRQAGCDSFVTKPCLPDALVAEIQRMLTLRAGGKPHKPPRGGRARS